MLQLPLGQGFGGSLSIVCIMLLSLFSLYLDASFCRDVKDRKQLMRSRVYPSSSLLLFPSYSLGIYFEYDLDLFGLRKHVFGIY